MNKTAARDAAVDVLPKNMVFMRLFRDILDCRVFQKIWMTLQKPCADILFIYFFCMAPTGFHCTGTGGILSLCETTEGFCGLETVKGASIR